MTNEEMEKTIEFILQQLAQSSANIGALAIAQHRSETKWERTEEGIRALLSIAEIHEREITAQGEQIAAQGGQIAAQGKQIAEQILELTETTRTTDDRLNALINIVERQISESRNGKP